MMTRQLIYILSIAALLFTGCNKVKQNAKKLDGTWTIYSYAQIQNGGFTTYYETMGTITFSTNADGSFSYQENYTYYKNNDTITSTRTGTGILKGDKAKSYDLTLTTPTNVLLEDCEIRVITKDDLKIQHQESDGGHVYVLQKN